MAHLADTNVLLRWAQPHLPDHPIAMDAVAFLIRGGDMVFITPQNLIEFWAVATRPTSANGLGMTPGQADREVARVEGFFPLLEDMPAIYHKWRSLVTTLLISGRQAHDARLVAVMLTHGVSSFLTFNTADFARYPDITVVNPHVLVAAQKAATGTQQP